LKDIYEIEPTLESIPLQEELKDISELYVVITFKKTKNEEKETTIQWDNFKDRDQPIILE